MDERRRVQAHVWLEELPELLGGGFSRGERARVALRLCGQPDADTHGLQPGDIVVAAVEADA
ncbi:MAG: hypothetical protein MK209_09785, partial [Planctomycetes bacterium]|nr:hypothetical protein [Planctomycetota bacterium]